MIPKTVAWSGDAVKLLDQTRLPFEEVFLECTDPEAVRTAICNLAVRGAPAIGIAAAYGLIVGLREARDTRALLEELETRAGRLISARPTAVNLSWALNRMMTVARTMDNEPADAILKRLESEAIAIHTEDAEACRAIGRNGLRLVREHLHLLTHCNAGSLAVSELGTALAPIYTAHHEGLPVHVFVDETRPLLQGARLTAYELQRGGVDITLIADSMAAHVMAQGKVDAVLVGADRVAANGDVANKVGTLNLAILCTHFGIPFYVACPESTIDANTPSGDLIEIEQRDSLEISSIAGRAVAPDGVRVFNPAFDVTPANLVSAIITERGVYEPPYAFSGA